MQVKGITAIVTGGASGLGEATAASLCENGANVVIADLNAGRGAAVVERLGARARYADVDVADPEQVQAAINFAVDEFGRLDVAVSCAGVAIGMRTVSKGVPHDLDMFKRVVGINLIGTFNVIRLVANQMAKNEPNAEGERGVIVNTASIAAFDGQIGQAAYSASKGGVVSLTLTVARDLASYGIRVCTIAPGVFETPMVAMMPEEMRVALGKTVPFPQRLGRPAEYALLVQQILENPFLNGETIRLDGALRMPPK